jgi:hypothetical protein
MDWWTTHGNYATYRGKDNEGKTRKAFAEEPAKNMAEETTSAQVQSKMGSTATQWCAAHEWAQATGAGLKERDLQETTTSGYKLRWKLGILQGRGRSRAGSN